MKSVFSIVLSIGLLLLSACDDDAESNHSNTYNTNNINAANNTSNTSNVNNANNTGDSTYVAQATLLITGDQYTTIEFGAENHIVCAEGNGDFMIVATSAHEEYEEGVRFTLGSAYMTPGEREFDAETSSPFEFEAEVTLGGEHAFIFGDEYSQTLDETRYSYCLVDLDETGDDAWVSGIVSCIEFVTSPLSPDYTEDATTFGPTIDLTLAFTCPFVQE